MKTPIVYLSGSIRNCRDGGRGWRQALIKNYSQVFEFLNPCRHNTSVSPQIVEQDKRDIEIADAVLVHIQKYSAGTLIELYFAYAVCDKMVVVVAPIQFHDDQWIREIGE